MVAAATAVKKSAEAATAGAADENSDVKVHGGDENSDCQRLCTKLATALQRLQKALVQAVK